MEFKYCWISRSTMWRCLSGIWLYKNFDFKKNFNKSKKLEGIYRGIQRPVMWKLQKVLFPYELKFKLFISTGGYYLTSDDLEKKIWFEVGYFYNIAWRRSRYAVGSIFWKICLFVNWNLQQDEQCNVYGYFARSYAYSLIIGKFLVTTFCLSMTTSQSKHASSWSSGFCTKNSAFEIASPIPTSESNKKYLERNTQICVQL